MVLKGRNVLQISVPRGGSNAVARMLGQSPDIAAVLRSPLLESGPGGLPIAAAQVAREAPDQLLYVKEHAAFLGGDRFEWFSAADRFLLVVRDPVQQLASAVVAVAGNRQLLRKKLSERRRRQVSDAQLAAVLDGYADSVLTELPLPVATAPAGGWDRLVGYVRGSHDFAPLAWPLAALFREQPERHACESDVEWFDRSLFQVVMRSWRSAVDLAVRLGELGAERVAVVDFTVLQVYPHLVAEVCDRLEIRYHPRMVVGPWRPAGRWFDAGLELADGHRWVERARRSTVLERPRSVPYDPLTLPAPARDVLGPGLSCYLTLLAHPAFVGPRSVGSIRDLFDDHRGFVAGNPVTAWSLACARTGVDSELTRSVEHVHPALRWFLGAARQHLPAREERWRQPAYTTRS